MKVTLLAKTMWCCPHDVVPEWTIPVYGEASDAECLIEFAGRNCYQSWDNPAGRTNKEYIANIIKQDHGSVLEHATVSFFVTGVSRSFTHELIRHRHLSFSELSQRYVDVGSAGYVVPPLFKDEAVTCEDMWGIVHRAKDNYNIMVDNASIGGHPRKQQREAARSVLPNCIETKIVVSGNLRAWREVLYKRGAEAADLEMRAFSCSVYSILSEEFPSVFFDFEEYTSDDGFNALRRVNEPLQ